MEVKEAITMESNVSSALKIQSLKEFAAERGFIQVIPKVRENVNGYLYLTFVDAENSATNVYFSINAAEEREAGEPLTGNILKTISVVETTNADGETRHKLTTGGGERIDLASIL